MDQKILVLDIETTGFLNKGGSIVEIGIVELNLVNGEVKTIFNSLLRESILTAKHRDAWIFSNSSLTVEEVREAPEAEGVLAEVQQILNKYPLGCTAYNKDFDFDFLMSRGLSIPRQLACPMKLSTPICKLPNKYNFKDYKWPTVEEAWNHFFPDVSYVEEHRGADDAVHEAQIVYALYKLDVFKV